LSCDELLKSQINAINDSVGELGTIDCPKCKNKGYVAEIRNGAIVCVTCECETQRRNVKQINQSGLKDVLERYTLETFTTQNKWQEQMKKSALNYLANLGGWFVVSGVQFDVVSTLTVCTALLACPTLRLCPSGSRYCKTETQGLLPYRFKNQGAFPRCCR